MMETLSKNFNYLSSDESELLEHFGKLPDEMKQEFLLFCKLIVEEQNNKEVKTEGKLL